MHTKGCKDRYLLNEQLLAHGDALIEPLLVLLQELLLLIYLSPQVTVCLWKKDEDCVECVCLFTNVNQTHSSSPAELTLSRSSIRPSFFSRSRLLLLSRAASFSPVNSVYKIQTESQDKVC